MGKNRAGLACGRSNPKPLHRGIAAPYVVHIPVTPMSLDAIASSIHKFYAMTKQNFFNTIHTGLVGAKFSDARNGNLLEAMNLALNALGRHYIDRSFTRTGLSLLVISPGNGAYNVDASMLDLTRRRIIDDGIGCDLITLDQPALHITPVFRWKATQSSKSNNYEIPTWIHQLYFDGAGVLHEGMRVTESNAKCAPKTFSFSLPACFSWRPRAP